MKQVFNQRGKIVVEEVPAPTVKSGAVLVKVFSSLISTGTEISSINDSGRSLFSMALQEPGLVNQVLKNVKTTGIKSTTGMIRQTLDELNFSPLGYSCAGIVIDKANDVNNINIGDRVACAGAGYANHAEYVNIPKNLVAKIPEQVNFEEAAFTTLGVIAMQGVRRANVQLGDIVVVIGLGLIGQLAIQILKSAGCRVIGYDLDPKRVQLAKKMKIDLGITINPVQKVLEYTNDLGSDSVLICATTKSNEPVIQAMEMCRKKGKVVIIGSVGLDIPRSPFYEKELDFLISCSYGPGRYDKNYEEKGIDYPIGYVRWTENRNMEEFLRLVETNKIDVSSLIDTKFDLKDIRMAYERLMRSNEKPISMLIKYKPEKLSTKVTLNKTNPRKGKINVGLIGCGGFAKEKHLPNINKLKNLHLRSVVTAHGNTAKQIGKHYEADYCTTDYRDVLKDKDIDMVLISTRHNLHVPITIEAVKANKHILVEKPMAMNYQECKEIIKTIKNSKVYYTVGFNRRYSPIANKAKEFLNGSKNPMMLTYRVNAGPLPSTHWINDPTEGGGRIIGEACHFFDFMNWIIDSKPVSIFAENISSINKNIKDNNNVMAIVKYANGSMGHLIYTSLGNSELPKEKVEIFCNGHIVIIDDFKKLILDSKQIKFPHQDKGHYLELVEFARQINGKSSKALGLKDSIWATILPLKAMDSVKRKVKIELDWTDYY